MIASDGHELWTISKQCSSDTSKLLLQKLTYLEDFQIILWSCNQSPQGFHHPYTIPTKREEMNNVIRSCLPQLLHRTLNIYSHYPHTHTHTLWCTYIYLHVTKLYWIPVHLTTSSDHHQPHVMYTLCSLHKWWYETKIILCWDVLKLHKIKQTAYTCSFLSNFKWEICLSCALRKATSVLQLIYCYGDINRPPWPPNPWAVDYFAVELPEDQSAQHVPHQQSWLRTLHWAAYRSHPWQPAATCYDFTHQAHCKKAKVVMGVKCKISSSVANAYS